MADHNDALVAHNAVEDYLDSPGAIPASWGKLSRTQAELALKQLSGNPEFRAAAIQRGTSAAGARIWLNAKKNGVDMPLDRVQFHASGGDPQFDPNFDPGVIA